MSSEGPWSVQSIIERVEAERRNGGGARHARRNPVPHRLRVWRNAVALVEMVLLGFGVAEFGGRHALR